MKRVLFLFIVGYLQLNWQERMKIIKKKGGNWINDRISN